MIGTEVVKGTRAPCPVWAGSQRSAGERSEPERSGEPAQTTACQAGNAPIFCRPFAGGLPVLCRAIAGMPGRDVPRQLPRMQEKAFSSLPPKEGRK